VTISVEITGDRQVGLKFEEFPRQAHDRLLETITKMTDRLEAAVLGSEPFLTGKLRSTTVEKVYSDNPDRIAGYVRIIADFGKAGALEYGSHRTITVNSRSAGQRGRQGHLRILSMFAKASNAVAAAYTRTTNIAAEAFLRNSLGDLEAEFLAELDQAMQEAVDE